MFTVLLIILSDVHDNRCSGCREAIKDCSTDFELGDLTIKGARGEAVTDELEAVHLGLDQTPLVVVAPLLPDRPIKPLDGPESFIAGVVPGAKRYRQFRKADCWDFIEDRSVCFAGKTEPLAALVGRRVTHCLQLIQNEGQVTPTHCARPAPSSVPAR